MSGGTNEWTTYHPAPGYPDDNPKTAIGVTKPPLNGIPPIAVLLLGQAMADGVRKYGRTNWREKRVSSSVYYDAAMRHLLAWQDGERCARDSGVPHLAHVMACCAILLDAESTGQLNDDRPSVPGKAADFIAEFTAAVVNPDVNSPEYLKAQAEIAASLCDPI